MIDLTLVRDESQRQRVIDLLKKKEPSYDIHLLISMDENLRKLNAEIESLRSKKNDLAKQAAQGITEEIRTQSREMSAHLKEKETQLQLAETAFRKHYLSCPNIPGDDLPQGGKESNKVVKEVGTKTKFAFPIKNHLELGNALGWFDFDIAASMTASNFALYKKDAAKLLYSLTMMMLKNNIEHGYEVIVPPYLLNERSLETASNFPKFRDQVYAIPEDGLFLSPTAEVNLTNIYRDRILSAQELPIRMTAWTSCFRREAGNYGSAERGLIRIHQFEKVELYTICEPENSMNELDRMVACAESILQRLGLHYRISLLAGQDCSFASAKTYDIEVWMPGQGAYYEVSSCSNCTDFQARRGAIRYRKTAHSKTSLVHTLNASSLALPRLMVALMETYQQADGSIALPEVLYKEGIFKA